jgi:ATP-dependent protease ClpP protease subunit
LYNVFKAHSPKLSLYNMGAVQSIGAIAFLGGNRRFVSSSATFMFHRTTSVPQQANLERLKYLAKSVASDDRITEGILRKHLNMGDEMWACLDQNDLLVSAEQAVEIGLAHEVREFLPPVGTKIISIQS